MYLIQNQETFLKLLVFTEAAVFSPRWLPVVAHSLVSAPGASQLHVALLSLTPSLLSVAWPDRDKDEDEGIPSETEDDKRQLETKAKEMRGERTLGQREALGEEDGSEPLLPPSDLLKQKDSEIMSLLEEKVQLFRGMWEGLNPSEDVGQQVEPFFRSASGQEPPRGASVLNNALQEGETLRGLCPGGDGGQKGAFRARLSCLGMHNALQAFRMLSLWQPGCCSYTETTEAAV